MTSRPVIVLLDDERPQLLAMRAALQGLGDVHDFSEPERALEFVRHHAVDVAIVDIHMPENHTDGIDFIRAVREFDRDLCVVVRTGDDSTDLADDAIEVRAYRRIIKGRASIGDLRALTTEAVTETRHRRHVTRDAHGAKEARSQMVSTLGSVDDELSVAEGCKAMLQSMRNGLTAISGFAEIMWEAAERGGNAFLKVQAGNNRALVSRMLLDVHTFLDGPFAESMRATQTHRVGTANAVLESVRQRFTASGHWLAQQRSFKVIGLSQDMFVSAAPLKLVTALRHLIEFCLQRSPPRTEVRLTGHCVEHALAAAGGGTNPNLIFNEQALHASTAFVVFRVRADLTGHSLESIRQAIESHPDDPRTGNLQMLALTFGEHRIGLVVARTTDDLTAFDLYVPYG
jgi:CheY-like chemotaxis protein